MLRGDPGRRELLELVAVVLERGGVEDARLRLDPGPLQPHPVVPPPPLAEQFDVLGDAIPVVGGADGGAAVVDVALFRQPLNVVLSTSIASSHSKRWKATCVPSPMLVLRNDFLESGKLLTRDRNQTNLVVAHETLKEKLHRAGITGLTFKPVSEYRIRGLSLKGPSVE